jgi:hypothetical protein
MGAEAVVFTAQSTGDLSIALENQAFAGGSSYVAFGADFSGLTFQKGDVVADLDWAGIEGVSVATTFAGRAVPAIEIKLRTGATISLAPSRAAFALFPILDVAPVAELRSKLEGLRLSANPTQPGTASGPGRV